MTKINILNALWADKNGERSLKGVLIAGAIATAIGAFGQTVATKMDVVSTAFSLAGG
jgi:hypothetical protein